MNKLGCWTISPCRIFRYLKEMWSITHKDLRLLQYQEFQIKQITLLTWALHIGHVRSLSNQVATHSSQNICLQCNIVASFKLSWQIGQMPPQVFKSSIDGFIPYCYKIQVKINQGFVKIRHIFKSNVAKNQLYVLVY